MPVLMVFALALFGCFASSGHGMVLPSQLDTGIIKQSTADAEGIGSRVAGRLSLAAAMPSPDTPFDVGVGYQVESFSGEKLSKAVVPEKRTAVFHGPTLDVAKRTGGGRHFRHWLGGRVELPMRNEGGGNRVGFGAALRASGELFVAGAGPGHCGALGLGGYMETGVRYLPGDRGALTTSVGLNLRLPFLAQ